MNGFSSILFISSATLGQAGQPQQPNLFATLLPILLIVVVMYFLMIRPQQKKQKAHTAMINAIKPGDEVVTVGGMYGTVAGVDEKKNAIYLKISNEVKVRVERHAIARVVVEDQAVTPK
ncbi:preprotein translocase subunit YajC [candidate division KSB1 bacterium]|nr:MAG: preprotein translocase subunit YajC [candidate division KSB1 bacterium]